MRRIYISMPVRDLFEDEIHRKNEQLLELVGEYLHEAVELVDKCMDTAKYSALECLGEDIKRMAGADYVLFADGWETERGGKIEMACALKYGKDILLEQNNKIEEVY